VFCPSCGFRNREGVSFCARCGASLIQDQDESQTTISFVPGEETGEAAPPRELLLEGASLVIRSGGGRAGETYPLSADRISVGRHPDSTIFLDDVTVSRNHARSRARGQRLVHRRQRQPERHVRQSPASGAATAHRWR